VCAYCQKQLLQALLICPIQGKSVHDLSQADSDVRSIQRQLDDLMD
jgi:hypothetical protein